MKKLLIICLVLGLIVVGGYQAVKRSTNQSPSPMQASPSTEIISQIEIVAQDLDTPWALALLPDQTILVTERRGNLLRINPNGQPSKIAAINQVKEIGEGGLLGIAVHPDFTANHYLYLYYTYDASDNNTLNRVVRYSFDDNQLSDPHTILDHIPGAANHNGGRIKFGPDKYLYIATGDAQNPSQSQDQNSVAGKILRVTDNGEVATGNPFNNQIFSFGHRNPQGIAWDANGNLWASEHGQRNFDEVNKIEAGKNYGWPEIEGDDEQEGMAKPYRHSGNQTWAPSGMAIIGNYLYLAGLRGQALLKVDLTDQNAPVTKLFDDQFGRIRDVIADTNGMLLITTSNLDGRGNPQLGDDKILKINPQLL